MRMAFGLVGLLVTLGVIVMIMHTYTLPATKKAIQTRKQVEEDLGGLTRAGMQEARDSITLDPQMAGNRFKGLLVKGIVAGGPMQTRYGLLPGDVIVGAKGMRLADVSNDDPAMAEDQVFESNGMKLPLTVVRGGQEMTLEAKKYVFVPAAGGAGGAGTVAPAPSPAPGNAPGNSGAAGDQPKGPRSPLEDLLKVPTH
jgi:hypothetical protein